MSESEKVIIPTKTVSQQFKMHLDEPGNKRILFSAPFGAGKSYFLEDYFNDEADVLSIRLHPVDYSVASNEDIFELLKHDIINGLIEKYSDSLKLEKEDFSNLLIAQEFIRNRMDFTGIGKAIFAAVVPNGESFVKIGDELKKINDELNNFKAEINDGQEKIIKDYLADLKTKKGSIRENDAITLIIKDFISRIKAANNNKKFVFIIDDLDRLDPEHLFRLFNVFTAHHDGKTDSNKFEFDQILFVCDIKNIHFMFRHKYGKKVDFSGYIDKFYSSNIFFFDFKKHLKESTIKLLLNKYNLGDNLPSYVVDRYNFRDVTKARDNFSMLKHVISELIDLDFIKIRSFEKFQSYRVPTYKFEFAQSREVHAFDYTFLVYISVLQQFFPRLNECQDAVEALNKTYAPDYGQDDKNHYYNYDSMETGIISISLPFLMKPEKAFGSQRREENSHFEYPNEKGDLMEIYYSIFDDGVIRYSYMKTAAIEKVIIPTGEATAPEPEKPKALETTIRPNPYWFFLEAFKRSYTAGWLRP
jgi:hypothetical protein